MAVIEISTNRSPEGEDWLGMLLRMYCGWAKKNGKRVTFLYSEVGDYGVGLGSRIIFSIDGEQTYKTLKGETGRHRLARISPFDEKARRHVSYASVSVYPEVDENQIIILPEDIRIEVIQQRVGGQAYGGVSRDVKITHLSTGLVVTCNDEKSQLRNRDGALKILRSLLYSRNNQLLPEGILPVKRQYILHPCEIVKDFENGLETQNIHDVLSGEIDVFLGNEKK